VEEVPAWLKGNFDTQPKEEKKQDLVKKEEKVDVKVETTGESKVETQTKEPSSPPEKEKDTPKAEANFDLEKDTKLVADENVPDWLK